MMDPPPRTPSPSSDIHTPPAPRHGYPDSYQPYSPKRKSARLAQRCDSQSSSLTSSPDTSSARHYSDTCTSSVASPQPRRSKKSSATMTSPTDSPQKKRVPAIELSRRSSSTLTAESTATAAAALGLSDKPRMKSERPNRPANPTNVGMLPTPAKTPQKPPTEENKANIQAIARNLFQNDSEIMPKPKKTRSQNYVLDSFSVDEAEQHIEIYTDSHERVPEIDASTDNPFYGQRAAPAAATAAAAPPKPPKRRSQRRTVSIPGEGRVSVDEALGREDGMVMNFRGKPTFRKFADMDDDGSNQSEGAEDAENSMDSTVEPRLRRPLTRSSVKPRLLFPPKPLVVSEAADEDEEEAATDIEDHVLAEGDLDEDEDEIEMPQTPMESVDKIPDTPGTPRFAPASPPATTRVTRQGSKSAEETTPVKAKGGQGGKRSPFDGWLRVKGGAKGQGHKRPGNALGGGPAKRTKI